LPANCVWSSRLFSLTCIPQTGSIAIPPPHRKSESPSLAAKTLPFVPAPQVTDTARFSFADGQAGKIARKILPALENVIRGSNNCKPASSPRKLPPFPELCLHNPWYDALPLR
jgi:hypothetical protein